MNNLDQVRQYLARLDLTYIVDAMCSPSYPLPRWSREDAQKCCALYKEFLFLQKKHYPESLVPTRQIDEFWHNHILYTKKYIHDCKQIFGHYLHHQPANPNDDPTEMIDAYLKTKEYYQEEYNRPLVLF